MYIADKYWNNYIGDTEDSLTLVEYLADRQQAELSLGQIFSDTGLDKLNGDYRQSSEPLTVVLHNAQSDYGEPYAEFGYAVNLVLDLAALVLECQKSGSVSLSELAGYDLETNAPDICITAAPEERELLCKALKEFAAEPLAYDISEMCSEEEMLEMAGICENLREELADQTCQ